MFANRSFMRFWGAKKSDRGNYYEAELSSSRKKDDGTYENDFASKFVRFVGKAAEKVESLEPKTVIQIVTCGVSNFYSKEKGREYATYVVFDFDIPGNDEKNAEKVKETREAAKGAKNDDLPEHTDESLLPF